MTDGDRGLLFPGEAVAGGSSLGQDRELRHDDPLVGAWRLTHDLAMSLHSMRRPRSAGQLDIDWCLMELINLAVPQFCDWCAVDLFESSGESRRFGFRHAACLDEQGVSRHDRCEPESDIAIIDHASIVQRAMSSGETQFQESPSEGVPSTIVVALRANDQPFGAITFANEHDSRVLGKVDVEAAEMATWSLVDTIERSRLVGVNREAVRQTQRIARQLHQLIAASIMVTGMRTEKDILRNLAASTRSVFDGDVAMVTLDDGTSSALGALARRGMVATSQSISADLRAETPMLRAGVNEPWIDRDWLVAPVLKSRDRSLGVIAVRRPVEIGFGPEDREVLTLLSQMASSALGATELARNIAASEDRLRVLIDTAPIGIVEVDLDGQVRYWNPAASRILAWREFTGTEVAPPTFPAATLAELRQLWAEATAGETINVRDIAGVKVAGRTRTLTVSAAPLPSSDGRAAGMLTLVDDVTNHRELKAELRHAHTMEIRGQVASRIAHDFNNLLTLISGYAEILGRDLESDERSAQMVEEIQSTASRASLLTSQLQAIGRTKVAEPVVFDPMAVIQSNAEVLERILGSKIEVQWSFGEPIGNIRTDADQFEQMILNLSINARDAMPDGGTLKFSVAPANLDSEAAAARALASGQYVKVLVSDTGLGMDSATLEKCFEPLFTTKGPFKGTGMGLASARRLMEESGGAIWCDSQLGHGTTFEIVFPLIDEPAQETSARPEVVRARGHATILIVEDDDGLRRLMSTVLKRNGYQVFEAESGESAIDVSRHIEAPIDLLLSDVVMGEMSGRDLASLLQSEHPSMRVLLVSGTEDRSVIDGLLAGSGSFLAKPFKPSQLIDEVHELLTRED